MAPHAAKEPRNELWLCCGCGSASVSMSGWVELNRDRTDIENGETWCPKCEAHERGAGYYSREVDGWRGPSGALYPTLRAAIRADSDYAAARAERRAWKAVTP